MPDVRLIDANEVLDFIKEEIKESKEERNEARARDNESDVAYNAGEIQEARRIRSHIQAAPTIDAVPVVNGQWLRENIRPKSYLRVCSMCKKTAYFCGIGCSYKFCPNCGARMDAKEEV